MSLIFFSTFLSNLLYNYRKRDGCCSSGCQLISSSVVRSPAPLVCVRACVCVKHKDSVVSFPLKKLRHSDRDSASRSWTPQLKRSITEMTASRTVLFLASTLYLSVFFFFSALLYKRLESSRLVFSKVECFQVSVRLQVSGRW